ncbi:DUF4241 domain-containing protein [Neobacillus sp. YIM B06451]|uniref:DUF4241 domain-containing protein n=1 Tax=Neobacillus sp. YIM B06451 TaxID=3070994 RepID=UPI00292ED04F|nr:DUF4241 domain-containing protein [Neobacillus sp. YIM B06451]
MVYKMNPAFLLFHDGEKRAMSEEREMFCKKIGEIELMSGRIVACDPFTGMDDEPFTKQVTPGKYPVLFSIIRYESKDERIAFAMIKFSNNKVSAWEMALQPGQNINELEDDDEYFGYGVDSGTGCFMDIETKNTFLSYENEPQDEDPGYELYLDLEDEFDKAYKATRSWIVTTIKDKASIAMFSSGWGDGNYPSFWGMDENGDIVCLITDFLIS